MSRERGQALASGTDRPRPVPLDSDREPLLSSPSAFSYIHKATLNSKPGARVTHGPTLAAPSMCRARRCVTWAEGPEAKVFKCLYLRAEWLVCEGRGLRRHLKHSARRDIMRKIFKKYVNLCAIVHDKKSCRCGPKRNHGIARASCCAVYQFGQSK